MNLFSALRRYRPTEGRDPLEDFLTEAWRWTLETHPVIASAFLARAGVTSEREVRWRTQLRLDDGRAILDLVGEVDDGPVVVCEHKAWSKLAPGQLGRYRAAAEARWPGRPVVTVLVTARAWQHTEPADLALTWSDVHRLIGPTTPSPMLAQLRDFLKEQGLGPVDPTLTESLLAWAHASRLESELDALMLEVARRIPAMPVAERIGQVCGVPLATWPTLGTTQKWGRLGVGLPSSPSWRPGVFVGALVDPTDHQVGWSRPELGPDLCVILSFQLRGTGTPDRSAFLHSREFDALLERLRATEGLDVVDARDRFNPWHPLHVRRPFVEVLGHEPAAHVPRAVAAAEGLLGALMEGGELEALARRLRA